MAARVTGVLALVLAACVEERSVVLPLPALDEDVRTVVLVFESDTGLDVEATKHDADGILIQRTGELEKVTAIYYEETIEQLGVEEGAVPAASSEVCLTKSLPRRFFRAFSRALDEEGTIDVELTELPDAIAAFRYRAPCPCSDLVVVAEVPIPDRFVTGALAIDETTALLVTETRLYRLHESGTLETLATPPGAPFYSAARSSDGTIWLGTDRGTLVSGTIAGGFVESSSRAASRVQALAAHRGDTPFELYSVHENGRVGRLDASGVWYVAFDEPSAESQQVEDVTWIAPGRAIALQKKGSGPIHYEHGATTGLVPWDVLLGPPSAVDAIDGGGVFLATRLHNIYQFESLGSWKELENDEGLVGTIRDLVPYQGGFLFTGQAARLGQYHPEAGFCFERNLEAGGSYQYIVPLANRIVLGGEATENNRVLLMEATRR